MGSKLYCPTFGIVQSCGHDVMYREKFDVAIARAVAEMRVLGILLQVSSMGNARNIVGSELFLMNFQLNIVFL